MAEKQRNRQRDARKKEVIENIEQAIRRICARIGIKSAHVGRKKHKEQQKERDRRRVQRGIEYLERRNAFDYENDRPDPAQRHGEYARQAAAVRSGRADKRNSAAHKYEQRVHDDG